MSYTLNQLLAMKTSELVSVAESSDTNSDIQRALTQHCIETENDMREMTYNGHINNGVSEAISQLPDEDFLNDIIKNVTKLSTGKMLKKDMVELSKVILDLLDDVHCEQTSAADYARDVLYNITKD